MEIIKHDKPKMPKITMNCDGSIDYKLEAQGEAIETCFSRPNFTIFSGGMGSGKTSFLLSMLKGPLRKTHHCIFVIIPEISLHSISEADNVFKKYEGHGVIIYNELTPEILEEIYSAVTANAQMDMYSMLLVDDFGPLLKQKQITFMLERFVTKMRHLKLGQIWILAQNYFQIPKKLRELGTNVLAWNTNKSQNKKLFLEQFQCSEDMFNKIIKQAPTTHDWILLNLKYKRLFNKDWNEIKISD